MQKIFFLLLILAFAFSKVTFVKSQKGRSIQHEAVALELEFLGSCAQFQTFYSTIQISDFVSPGCLPISLTDQPVKPDFNDLHAHIHCVDVNHGKKSIVRFVEIFLVDDDHNGGSTVEPTLLPGHTYLVSLISNIPFKVTQSSTYSYMYRPTCDTAVNYCERTTYIIHSCQDHNAVLTNGYVSSNQRVYLVPSSTIVAGCSLPGGGCCPYVLTNNFGICTDRKSVV